jgi:hypothetical protein
MAGSSIVSLGYLVVVLSQFVWLLEWDVIQRGHVRPKWSPVTPAEALGHGRCPTRLEQLVHDGRELRLVL